MDLSQFNADAQQRIKAGLLEIDSRASVPGQDWYARFIDDIHLAYDIFADELLRGGRNPEDSDVQMRLRDVIPALVSDVIIEFEWLRGIIGRSEPDAEYSERFGTYYLQEGRLHQISDCL